MRIRIDNFKGLAPRVQPRLLPPGFAQLARNAVMETGTLRPLREAETVYTFDEAMASFIRHDGAWYGWTDPDVSAVPGPVAADRLYITGDGAPKMQYQGVRYPLALSPPEDAPIVAFTNAPDAPAPNDPDDEIPGLPASGGTIPAALRIVRQPVGSISGYVMLTQPAIAVVDSAGLLCAGDNATEVAVEVSDGVLGFVGGTRTVTATGGIVRFTDLIMRGDDETDYRLSFAADDLTGAVSDIVTVTADMAPVTSTIVYAYTFVTSLGEESPPSALSEPLDWYPGLIVRLSNFSAAPTGRLITKMRIYRSVTSASGVTDLYFVAEVPASTLTYDHDLEAAPIAEVIPSADYDQPPDDMDGIIALPNGMMAAFSGRELLFSEPYKPHAWPVRYRLAVDYDIVGLGAFGSTVAVMTTGTPYIVTGSAPENMAMERLELALPCINRRGIVDLGYAVAYPSADGLVTLGPGGAQLVTRALLTRDQWRAMAPESFLAAQDAGRYLVAHRSAGTVSKASAEWALQGIWNDTITTAEAATLTDARQVSVFDLTGDAPFMATAALDILAMHFSVEDGRLYVIEAEAPAAVKEWDSGEAIGLTWRSGIARTGAPVNFGAALISAEGGPGTANARIFADGALVATVPAKNLASRLPSGFLASEWEVEIDATAEVHAIAFASTMEELTND